jgi:hypothetical protein
LWETKAVVCDAETCHDLPSTPTTAPKKQQKKSQILSSSNRCRLKSGYLSHQPQK